MFLIHGNSFKWRNNHNCSCISDLDVIHNAMNPSEMTKKEFIQITRRPTNKEVQTIEQIMYNCDPLETDSPMHCI